MTEPSRQLIMPPRDVNLLAIREGTDYGRGAPPSRVTEGVREMAVMYKGTIHKLWVWDRGVRPPDTDGVWLDDLLTASCRRVFGSTQGTARAVQGVLDYMEFREWWPNPLIAKVVQRVPLVIEPEGRATSVKVSCRAVPGAEIESVIVAELDAFCRRQFPIGSLKRRGYSVFVWDRNDFSAEDRIKIDCRYTVTKGGQPHEVLLHLPPGTQGSWETVTYLLSKECLRRWGGGRLQYEPEQGECYFSWT